jgi:hypothetical protein
MLYTLTYFTANTLVYFNKRDKRSILFTSNHYRMTNTLAYFPRSSMLYDKHSNFFHRAIDDKHSSLFWEAINFILQTLAYFTKHDKRSSLFFREIIFGWQTL